MTRRKSKAALGKIVEPIILKEMISEGFEPWVKQLDRLHRAKPGSREYRNALCELWTLAEIVKIKGEVACEVIEQHLDSLPE